ncbi:MAG TPA: hypothetical protein VGB65_06885 [Allosphingosinicella sp.]|jgi:ubiquitin
MAGDKDPFRAAEAQAAEQKQQREDGQPENETQGEAQQQPTTAEFEAYDEEVGSEVKGIEGASAGGPAA